MTPVSYTHLDVYKRQSIGCLYGYGGENELEKADVKVNSISELKEALLKEAGNLKK